MELDEVQIAYNRIVCSLVNLFTTFDYIDFDDAKKVKSRVAYYESIGYRLVQKNGELNVRTSSGFHFTKKGISNVLEGRLETGNPLVVDAKRAYDYLRLRSFANLHDDPIARELNGPSPIVL